MTDLIKIGQYTDASSTAVLGAAAGARAGRGAEGRAPDRVYKATRDSNLDLSEMDIGCW